jgi:hypothetical protein
MAVGKAAIAGAIAALGLPWVFRGGSGQLADWVQAGMVHFNIASVHLVWSWPIFCVVTLFAWALIAWAGRS